MIRNSIPNLFTVGNLFLGIISIMLVFHERPDLAAILVIVAMLLDGLDGRIARALNVQSEFGKELDSLSDVVSFGVAPAPHVAAGGRVMHRRDLRAPLSAWSEIAILQEAQR